MTDGFGYSKKDHAFSKYIGKYVVISISGENRVGKLKEFDKYGHVILNPHQGIIYGEMAPSYKIIHENDTVNLNSPNFTGIKPTTKESIKNFCEFMNKQNQTKK